MEHPDIDVDECLTLVYSTVYLLISVFNYSQVIIVDS